MTVVVEVMLNGIAVPVTLDEAALAAIAAAAERNTVEGEATPQWMNVASLSRYLDCTPERIRKLVARKSIPYVQEGVGCRLSFDRDAIDDWMRQSAHPARGGGA